MPLRDLFLEPSRLPLRSPGWHELEGGGRWMIQTRADGGRDRREDRQDRQEDGQDGHKMDERVEKIDKDKMAETDERTDERDRDR